MQTKSCETKMGDVRRATTKRDLVLFSLVVSLASACSSRPKETVADEKSVKPGINERFLSSELDMNWAVNTFENESREIVVCRERIVERLGLKPGMVVADVGAGTGLFLETFLKTVGSGGKVYAADISPKFIEHMNQRIEEKGWAQAETVLSRERSVPLPDGSLDLVFVCDTYHHFEFPRSMLASLHRALRPGGRLVIVDFERLPGVSREWILNHVRAGKDEVSSEITAAGFTFVDELKVEGLSENYLLRFRR
jgi:ubiquinone/menaquinone biosynthesis C-methylase UbiE